jgi:hypothetical protein
VYYRRYFGKAVAGFFKTIFLNNNIPYQLPGRRITKQKLSAAGIIKPAQPVDFAKTVTSALQRHLCAPGTLLSAATQHEMKETCSWPRATTTYRMLGMLIKKIKFAMHKKIWRRGKVGRFAVNLSLSTEIR